MEGFDVTCSNQLSIFRICAPAAVLAAQACCWLRRRPARGRRGAAADRGRHGAGRADRMARHHRGARHGARERIGHADREGQRDRAQGRLRQRRHRAGRRRHRRPLERRAARRPRGSARVLPGGGTAAGARPGARADEGHLREPARHAALDARCREGAHGRRARAALGPRDHGALRRRPRPPPGQPGLARDAGHGDRDARRHLAHQARLPGAGALPRRARARPGRRREQRDLSGPRVRGHGRERRLARRSRHALGHGARRDPERRTGCCGRAC